MDTKTKDQRDAEAHETDQKRVEWHMEGEKIWCLHRALGLNEKSETAQNLGLNGNAFWDDAQTEALKKLYYKKLLAL